MLCDDGWLAEASGPLEDSSRETRAAEHPDIVTASANHQYAPEPARLSAREVDTKPALSFRRISAAAIRGARLSTDVSSKCSFLATPPKPCASEDRDTLAPHPTDRRRSSPEFPAFPPEHIQMLQ